MFILNVEQDMYLYQAIREQLQIKMDLLISALCGMVQLKNYMLHQDITWRFQLRHKDRADIKLHSLAFPKDLTLKNLSVTPKLQKGEKMKKGDYFCGEDFFGKMVLYIPFHRNWGVYDIKKKEKKEGEIYSDIVI